MIRITPRSLLRAAAWIFFLSFGSLLCALWLVLAGCVVGVLPGCTPAERAALGVPVLSQVDAIGATIAEAVGWCADHGATPDNVFEARKAIADKDPGAAVDVVRKMFEASAKAGEPVPPEVVALVQTAEGAIAAQGVQDGMRALSTGGAPP